MSSSIRHHCGFTLLELIIAMSLFAVLSLLSYSGLNSVLNTRDVTQESARNLAELQTAFLMIQRDIEQATNRSVRDQLGDSLAALSTSLDNHLIEFTRDGWPNPTKSPISSLRRIAYTLKDNKLIRLSWAVLDRAHDTEPQEIPILTNIDSVSFRLMDQDGIWQPDWPPLNVEQFSMPTGLEISIQHQHWGLLKRIFRVNG